VRTLHMRALLPRACFSRVGIRSTRAGALTLVPRYVPRQVYKRFSHFCDLRETLFDALTDKRFKDRPAALVDAVELLPELPSKVYIGNSFAPAVVEERRSKLRTFLQMVVALPDAAQLAILQRFLRQPDEVLAPDSDSSNGRAAGAAAARAVTYSSARPWVVPRGPSASDLPSPDEWRDQARRGWEITGEYAQPPHLIHLDRRHARLSRYPAVLSQPRGFGCAR
jgi:hypothetical protein